MPLRLILTRAGTATVIAILIGCGPAADDTLVFTIEQALATTPGGAALHRSVSGDWDRLCVFRPYTRAATVDSVLATSTNVGSRSGIETQDSHVLLVFAHATAVERWVMYPRAKGDFTAHEGSHCVSRDDAVFELRHPIDGSIPWVGPVRSPRPGGSRGS